MAVGWPCPWLRALPTGFHCERRFLSPLNTRKWNPALILLLSLRNKMKWIGSYLANLPCSNFSYQRSSACLFFLVFRRLQICLKMSLSGNGFFPIFHCVSFHQSNYLFNSMLLLFIACDTSSKPSITFQNGSVFKAAADCPFLQLLLLNRG